MLNYIKTTLFSLILISAFSFPAHADLKKALKAANVKDYATAYSEYNETLNNPKSTRTQKVHALTSIGAMHQNGLGRPKNIVKALGYYEPAAEAGFMAAQYFAANIYLESKKVPHDYKKAFAYYVDSTNQGYYKSSTQLGFMYQYGLGRPIDKVSGLAAYIIGYEGGHKNAKPYLESLKAEMTQNEVAEAILFVKQWRQKFGKK